MTPTLKGLAAGVTKISNETKTPFKKGTTALRLTNQLLIPFPT